MIRDALACCRDEERQDKAAKRRDKGNTNFPTSHMSPIRSLSLSPSPRIPPEQTLIPASCTAEIVLRRSSYVRVVITCMVEGVSRFSAAFIHARGSQDLRVIFSRSVQIMVICCHRSVRNDNSLANDDLSYQLGQLPLVGGLVLG